MSTSPSAVSTFDHAAAASGRSLWHLAWLRLKRNRAALAAAVILGLIGLLVVFGPLISQYDYATPHWDSISVPPSLETGHFFGTDSIGRALYVRTLYGGRMSLMVGLVATGVALIIGVAWGAIAGFVGGRVDNVMMRIVDILYAYIDPRIRLG